MIGGLKVERRDAGWFVFDTNGKLLCGHKKREEAERFVSNHAAELSASPRFADPGEHGSGGHAPQVIRRK